MYHACLLTNRQNGQQDHSLLPTLKQGNVEEQNSSNSIEVSFRERFQQQLQSYKEQPRVHRIWIMTIFDSVETIKSVQKIMRYFESQDNINTDDVFCFDQKDIMLRMDTESGLSVYIQGVKMSAPKVFHCRIGSDVIEPDYHITVLRHLQLMGSRIVNNIDAIMKTTNKAWHLQDLAAHGIPIATTLSYNYDELKYFQNVDNTLRYPIVMKMVRGNGGNMVFLIGTPTSHSEMTSVLNNNYPYIYQEYIKESHGKDLRIIVIDHKPVFSMIRQSKTESFRANLKQGGHGDVVTGKFPDAEELAVKISKIINIEVCGVDLLFSDKYGYICCEVNNNPGFSKSVYDDQNIEKYLGDMLIQYSA